MGSEHRKLHFLFFPLMAQGHAIPLIDMARLFSARGAKSTILATPLNALHFTESIDRDKQSGQDINIEIIPFPGAQAGLPEGCEDTNSVTSMEMAIRFFKALDMLQEPFDKVVQQLRPDCIVADVYIHWSTDVGLKYGVPRLVFHGTSYFSLCVAGNIERFSPQEKVMSESEIFVVPDLPHPVEMTRSQLPYGGDNHEKNINPFSIQSDKIQEAERKSFGVIVNSFYELEPGYADYYRKGRRAWCTGPVSLYNRDSIDKAQRGKKGSIDAHYCLSWLDSKKPNSVLYVSFGSLTRFPTAQRHEIALGLEASKVPFIWVARLPLDKEEEEFLPEGFEERVEGRGLVIRDWAPQMLILDHPAVGGFMTHCGWNSTLEGISRGLPLITWPVFAEQFNNEKLVTQVLKTGIRAGDLVWNYSIEPEGVAVAKDMVEKVVVQLMGDGKEAEEMRRRAKEIGEMAKRAVEKGGSSYNELNALFEEIKANSECNKKKGCCQTITPLLLFP